MWVIKAISLSYTFEQFLAVKATLGGFHLAPKMQSSIQVYAALLTSAFADVRDAVWNESVLAFLILHFQVSRAISFVRDMSALI